MNILEPNEALRRIKLTRICLEHQQKAPSPMVASLFGDLALHNIRLAEEKLKALITGMDGLVFYCQAEEQKETEPFNPLTN